MQRTRTGRMARIALCAALMSVCAWIAIPAAVPFTMQSFAVLLSCLLLGGRDGMLAVAVYLLTGLVGLPVFSGMRGGVGVFASPTGGFLMGFLAAAVLLRMLANFFSDSLPRTLLSMLLAQILLYLIGALWFSFAARCTPAQAIAACVLPYLVPDLVKLLLALWLFTRLRRVLSPRASA